MLKHTPKIILTILFIVAAIFAIAGNLDKKGETYTSDTLKRSLLSFGVARALNGVISVAQGTEIAVQPAGIGVNFTPGEILDPVNDIVERFSWVMLVSSASLGIQNVLLTMTSWPVFSWFTVLVLLVTVVMLWVPKHMGERTRWIFIKLALVMMLLRFSVSIIAIGSELVYQEFLMEQYLESTEQLQHTTENIGNINKSVQKGLPENANESILESAKRIYSSAISSVDLEARMNQYKAATEDATRHIVNLIVVFVFQTILMPLLFLLCLVWLLKNLIRSKLRALIPI
jgi:amino acid permease